MPAERKVRTSTTYSMEVIGGDLTVGDLWDFLEGLSREVKVSLSQQSPDRPGELTVLRLKVTEE